MTSFLYYPLAHVSNFKIGEDTLLLGLRVALIGVALILGQFLVSSGPLGEFDFQC